MRIHLIVFALLSLAPLHAGQKLVSGDRPAGLFSNFVKTLHHLNYCQKNAITPVVYWGSTSHYYQADGWHGKTNVWEYYFQPVSELSYQPGDLIHTRFWGPDNSSIDNAPDEKIRAKELIDTYIRLQPWIEEKIDAFYATHFKNKITIGIHLRGTDKKIETQPVDPLLIFAKANACAARYSPESVQFFVATDEQRLLDLAHIHLKWPVIAYDSIRSTDESPLHLSKELPKAQLGEEILIETILLSRCNLFLHTHSNVSTCALYFNPELNHILFDSPTIKFCAQL